MGSERGVCEVIRGEGSNPMDRVCEQPATLRYPAMGGGHMRLCDQHGAKHLRMARALNLERWTDGEWLPAASLEDQPR
jgi:hypothetical protein